MIRLLAVLALLGLLTAGYFSWADHQQSIGEARAAVTYNQQLGKQKDEAKALLIAETVKAEASKMALQVFKNNQEIKDAHNTKTVTDLGAQLYGLGRLRDPNQTFGCGLSSGSPEGGTPASSITGTGDGAQATGLLSAELTQFLREKMKEADDINTAYISCRQDSFNLRSVLASDTKGSQ